MSMPATALDCHRALLELMGDASLDDVTKLGELLVLRGAVQAAISTIALKIQAEHPGALV